MAPRETPATGSFAPAVGDGGCKRTTTAGDTKVVLPDVEENAGMRGDEKVSHGKAAPASAAALGIPVAAEKSMEDGANLAPFRFNFAAAPAKDGPGALQNLGDSVGGDDEENETLLPPPREVLSTEVDASTPFLTDPIVFQGGLTLLKGRVSTAKVIGVGKVDLLPGRYEGGLKLWECTVDLVNTMQREMKDGQLSFRGKRVLEVGCGHGLPGIFSILKGATTVHFQDFNAEVLRSLTIPNVAANLDQSRLRSKVDKVDSAAALTFGQSAPEMQYYAGDWSDVHELLSAVGSQTRIDEEDTFQAPDNSGANGDASSADEGIRLQKKKSNNSMAFQQAHLDVPIGGYDFILMSETVYSLPSLPKLYNLIKKCLRPPYGVLYVGAKKHYFGVGGGTRQFKSVVDKDGILGSRLVTDFADGSSNVREVWKFFFKKPASSRSCNK